MFQLQKKSFLSKLSLGCFIVTGCSAQTVKDFKNSISEAGAVVSNRAANPTPTATSGQVLTPISQVSSAPSPEPTTSAMPIPQTSSHPSAVATSTPTATPAKNWLPKGIFGNGESWVFHIRDTGIPPFNGDNLTNAIAKYKLGGVGTVKGTGGRPVRNFDEFDYTYYGIQPGAQIGDGTYRDNRDCYGPQAGCYKSGPANKDEAYGRLNSYWNNHLNPPSNALIKATTGHYYFQHYAAEWGAHLVVSEVGEGITSVNAHLAFTRGAARQHGIGWGMDFSAWYGPYMRDYSQRKIWGAASGPDFGHSISLAKRVYYNTYMSGAQYLLEEAGGAYFFNGERLGSDGLPALSPFGTMAQEFAAFVEAHPDRGQPYAFAAVLLEHKHGMGLGWWNNAKPWDYLTPTAGYNWTTSLINNFWPGSFSVMPPDAYPESNFMVAGPNGDTVDVLLENASLETLKNYKVIYLSGDLDPSRTLLSKLYQYLVSGGTVVIQYPQQSIAGELKGYTFQQNPIENIPVNKAFRYPYGQGSVVRIEDASVYGSLIPSLYREKAPVLVHGNVEFMLNRLEKSWVVTLINNNGVQKRPNTAVVNDGGRVKVIIEARAPITKVNTWRSVHQPVLVNGQPNVFVNSGDVAVLEIPD